MGDQIVNPFKQVKKNDWTKKTQERLNKAREGENLVKTNEKPIRETKISKNKDEKIERVAKSFKIYPGKIPRDFDKRVNKLQVYFDDLDYNKDYVDSGKYLMFIMSFAEKYNLYDLYREVDKEGNFDLDKENVKKHLEALF